MSSRFHIIRKLGEGGMAMVYLATVKAEGAKARPIALKKMRREAMLDPEQVDLFLREVRIAARLNHPNVVQIFDAGMEDDGLFLTLEYVDGPDLEGIIAALQKARTRLHPAHVAWIGARICDALSYVKGVRDEHGKLLVSAHRDISPSNVLVTSGGEVKLADFGVVRLTTSGTAVGIVKGKWEFFPPEIITGKPQDMRGDLFALGITLYKLFALRHPFFAPTPQEHFQRARTEEPEKPERMPEGLWAILRSALDREPEHRPQTPAEMAGLLDRFAASTGERVGPRALAEQLARLPALKLTPPREPVTNEEDPDDAPTSPDVAGARLAAAADGEPEDGDDETTQAGIPDFARALQQVRSEGRESTGIRRAKEASRLYDELKDARTRHGLKMELSPREFEELIQRHEREILAKRPGAQVSFAIGERDGKPVVVPRVVPPRK